MIIERHYAGLASAGKKAATLASAIEINQPVNLPKALRALEFTRGVVREVSDAEILDAKAQVGAGGGGRQPARAGGACGGPPLRARDFCDVRACSGGMTASSAS